MKIWRSLTPWLSGCLRNAVGHLIAMLIAAGLTAGLTRKNPETIVPPTNYQDELLVRINPTDPNFCISQMRT